MGNTVITSFTYDGYRLYGKEFVATFRQFWQDKLVIWYEGSQVPEKSDGQVKWRYIEEIDGLERFMLGVKTFPVLCGKIPHPETGQLTKHINFDARMGRKTYMQVHSLKQFKGKVFWLDADSITHSKVPKRFLNDCLPNDKLCCFLGRDGWYHTESGFIGFNSSHEMATGFMRAYRAIFDEGIFLLPSHMFNEAGARQITANDLQAKSGVRDNKPPFNILDTLGTYGFHDCYAFDFVRRACPQSEFVDLAADLPRGTMHPFVNSVLGKYMDHRKGKRKNDRSDAGDLVVEREEGYWKDSK